MEHDEMIKILEELIRDPGIARDTPHCDDRCWVGEHEGESEWSMRKAVMPFVLSVGLIAVWAAPANASTRAEYIAQADPICAQTLGEAESLIPRFNKAFKKGRFKQAGRIDLRINDIFDAMVVSLAALQPPAEDASLIDSWLNGERAQSPIAIREARALMHRKLKRARYTSTNS